MSSGGVRERLCVTIRATRSLGLGVPSATETRATARPVATCAPATEPEPELKSLDVGKRERCVSTL